MQFIIQQMDLVYYFKQLVNSLLRLLQHFVQSVLGAHFASDVTMGATITLIIFTLLKNKYIKNMSEEIG